MRSTHDSAVDRRRFLQAAGSAGLVTAVGGQALTAALAAEQRVKTIAAVVTIYRKDSHADVLVGKILDGWKQDGGVGPALRLASLYVDQFPSDDLSVKLAEKHGFRLCKSIPEAITLGTDHVAVDGVLSIGEHGDYPHNEKGQHLYPRRRFFEEITATFQRHNKVVPVFNDKHPGPQWSDALWMAQRARDLKMPWMAGSSLPYSFRDPDVTLAMGSRVKACVGVGYSGLDVYGFHTLEFLQCMLERRQGAETGVEWVQSHPTSAIPHLLKDGTIRGDVLDAALKSSRTDRAAVLKAPPEDGAVFLIQYRDGLLAPVLMLPRVAQAISCAFQAERAPIAATRAEERPEPRYPHFAYMLKGIEQMMHTGRPAVPVERSLLTAGLLDRLLTSRHEGGRRIVTPELHIAYTPTDFGHAPHIDLLREPG